LARAARRAAGKAPASVLAEALAKLRLLLEG
jgi:hypothetical protein